LLAQFDALLVQQLGVQPMSLPPAVPPAAMQPSRSNPRPMQEEEDSGRAWETAKAPPQRMRGVIVQPPDSEPADSSRRGKRKVKDSSLSGAGASQSSSTRDVVLAQEEEASLPTPKKKKKKKYRKLYRQLPDVVEDAETGALKRRRGRSVETVGEETDTDADASGEDESAIQPNGAADEQEEGDSEGGSKGKKNSDVNKEHSSYCAALTARNRCIVTYSGPAPANHDNSSDIWIVDSGATHTIVSDFDFLSHAEKLGEEEFEIQGIGNTLMYATHRGIYIGHAPGSTGSLVPIVVHDVYYIEGIGLNLFSATATQKRQRFGLTLGHDNATGVPTAQVNLPTGENIPLQMADGAWLLKTQRGTASTSYSRNSRVRGDDDPEYLEERENRKITFEDPKCSMACTAMSSATQRRILHERFGHINDKYLDEMAAAGIISLPKCERPFCAGCLKGKQRKKARNTNARPVAEAPLDEIASDIVGPFKPESRARQKYFVVFVDRYTRHVWVYFMKTKDELPDVLERFLTKVCTDGKQVKVFRSDSGTEYLSAAFRGVLAQFGPTRPESSAPYFQCQNGLAERMVGTLKRRALAMMHARNVPDNEWANAIQHAAHITNLMPTRALPKGETPRHMWSGDYGPVEDLRTFYCPAYVKVDEPTLLASRSREGRYLGPSNELTSSTVKAHRILLLDSGREISAAHVEFNEDAYETASPQTGGSAAFDFSIEESALDEGITAISVEPELPVDELPAVEAGAQDMPAEPPMTRAPTGAELGEPADASETAAPTGAGTDGAEAGAQEEIAPRRPPAKLRGSPVQDWHERAQESWDLKGIHPVARYSTALMGKALETKRICVRWPDHSDNDAGWCCVTVKSYVKKRRNPYELLFLHDGAIEKRELLPKFYNTCWDAPIGSWFLADENRSTKLAAVVLDDASRPEPANGIRARVAAARAGDEHWTLDKLIAAITCPGAAEREGSDWPERLTLEDLEGYGHAVATYYDLHKDSPAKGRAYYSTSNIDGTAARDPRTHKEAMESAYASDWEKAEQAEWDSLVENGVYDEVPVPAGVKPLGSRMVYKTKLKADGSIERHKARIVAQGYSQIPGIDYPEDMTHAPVVRHTSVKAVLAVAAKRSISRKKPWKVHGMDVSTAYLQSPLDEPVHVYHPKGFEKYNRRGERLCLRLKKSLYGLKQSANNWNRCIDAWFKEQGFTPNDADPCLYVLRDKAGGIMMLVCLYVDDLLIAGSDEDIAGFKAAINARFTMKDLGELSYLLGMEISFQDGAVHISQKKYIDEMLDIYGMSDCKPAPTPTLDGQRLTKAMQATTDEDKKEMQGVRYRHAVGHLLYLTSITRFDIANPVRELARFMENPGPEHWAAVKRVFRYLAGTKGKDLILGPFPPGELKLIGYSDSDWAGDPDTRRSTTGYVFVLGDEQSNICSGAISANSRLQPTVALSSTEAEYMAVCSAAAEAIYLRALIGGLGYPQTAATIIYEDNQSAMALANAAINQWHPRTRHMDVRYKFVKERVRSNEVRLVYVRTVEQLADVLTKNLGGNTFRKFAAILLGHR